MSSVEQGSLARAGEARTFPRRAIVPVAIVFFVLQAIGTIIAVVNRLPYEAAGVGDPDRVASDFLMGGGTALSAPLFVLVILALLIAAGRRYDRWGTVALIATALLSGVMTVFGVSEPITGRMLRASPFGVYEAAVVVMSVVGLLALAAVAVLSVVMVVWRVRR